jgi:hypothetical protein
VTQSAGVLALPATPALAVSASTVCLGMDITFRVTSPMDGATYTWSGAEGTPSGTGNCSYTVSGATTGTKSVTAYASQTSNGTTCQSANSSLSAYVSQPGADGEAVDASCGCASGLTSCTNTNTCRTPTTTYQDGGCAGVCNERTIIHYDECGVESGSSTYTDESCSAGCQASWSEGCATGGTQLYYCTGTASCQRVPDCQSYASELGYRYYYLASRLGRPYGLRQYCYGCN